MVSLLWFVVSTLAAEPAADPVVARVQGFEIHASEFAAAAKRARPADGLALTAAERRQVLDTLIDDRLLAIEAAKSPEVLDTPAVRAALIKAYLQEEIYEEIREPNDTVLQKFYDADPKPYVTPETVRVSRILVRVGPKVDAAAAKAQAEKLRAAVAKDPKSSFAATAKKSSQDENAEEGGDMGFLTRGDKKADKALVKAAFAAKPGTVTPVFMTREGANVLYVSGKRASKQRTFEQAHADVLKRWKQQKLDEARKARLAKLEKGTRVSVDDAALAAVPVPAPKQKAPAAGQAPAAASKGGKAGAARPAPAPEPPDDEGGDDEGADEDED